MNSTHPSMRLMMLNPPSNKHITDKYRKQNEKKDSAEYVSLAFSRCKSEYEFAFRHCVVFLPNVKVTGDPL